MGEDYDLMAAAADDRRKAELENPVRRHHAWTMVHVTGWTCGVLADALRAKGWLAHTLVCGGVQTNCPQPKLRWIMESVHVKAPTEALHYD